MLYNRYGFISFKLSSGPEPADLLDLPLSGFAPLSAAVIIAPGETYSFYIAATTPINLGNNIVGLVLPDSLIQVIGAIGSIESFIVDADGTKNFIVKMTIPANISLANGYYRLRLNLVAGTLYSNRVWLRKSGYEGSTALFSYRNRRAIGPIAYDLPETQTFRNVLRLKCSFGRTDTDSNLEQYERVTTGEKVTTLVKSYSYVSVNTSYTDAYGQEGWRTLTMHKDLLINGKPYAVKTGFTIGDQTGGLGIGSFELWDQGYSVVNRC